MKQTTNLLPKDPNRDTHRVPGSDLLRDIIKQLRDEHLLVFGVILLIFLFSIGSGVLVVVQNKPDLIYLPFISLLCGLGAVVYIVSKTHVPVVKSTSSASESATHVSDHDLPVREFNEIISAIRANLRTALEVDNDVFRQAMLSDTNEFRAMTGSWAQHQVDSQGRSYNSVLIQLYSSAKKFVFSTSMPEYLGTWNGPLGRLLLEAHARSEAQVTRIFIFDKRDEVTAEAVAAMQGLAKSIAADRMSIRVWIDSEDPAFDFPPLLSRDFTIIDEGAAIGITQKVDGDEISARWYFRSEEFTPICCEVADRLKRGSIKFADFLSDWKRRTEQ